MLSKLLLTIFCAFFSSSARCLAPTPFVPPVSPPIKNQFQGERYSTLTYLTPSPGKNTYRIILQNPLPSDGFQVHLKLDGVPTVTLTKTQVTGLNTLTSRTSNNEIWLAAITKTPTTPWFTTKPVEVAKFSFTSASTNPVIVTLGSSSALPQHKSTANLLDTGIAHVTIERVTN